MEPSSEIVGRIITADSIQSDITVQELVALMGLSVTYSDDTLGQVTDAQKALVERHSKPWVAGG